MPAPRQTLIGSYCTRLNRVLLTRLHGMSSKTPSSLLWLIRKQTRLVGLIERRSEELGRLKARIADIEAEVGALTVQRSQIESVLKLHEVQVDPRHLRAIRPHETKRLLNHGGITRVVMAFLRDAPGHTATTVELVAAVIHQTKLELSPNEHEKVKRRVRVRLSIMASAGRLVPVRGRDYCTPCSWHLATALPEIPSGSPSADPGGGDA